LICLEAFARKRDSALLAGRFLLWRRRTEASRAIYGCIWQMEDAAAAVALTLNSAAVLGPAFSSLPLVLLKL